MYFLLTVIAFVVIFSIIILIHEFGHFIVARRNGVKVEEFGIGLPPRIWSIKRRGVIYSLNLLPFGGFCRLLGEDSKDQRMTIEPQSFISKPLRVRAKIIVAGVLMNFLLAIVLLSIGFSVGMKPLVITEDDVFSNISNGAIQINEGIAIKGVAKGSSAYNAGFKQGDIVMQMDGKDITDFDSFKNILASLPSNWPTIKVRRGDSILAIPFRGGTGLDSGIELYDMFFLPRVVIKNVAADSEMARLGLKNNDVILRAGKEQIYNIDRFQEILDESSLVVLTVLRDYKKYEFTLAFPFRKSVIVSGIVPMAVAEKAGFMRGDYILEINGAPVAGPKQVVNAIKASPRKSIQFLVERNGSRLVLYAVPNSKGEIGVIISKVFSLGDAQFSAYVSSVPTSILEIKKVSYPVYKAVWVALTESKRLAVFTAQMFGRLVKEVLGTFRVPDGISGPVGIAHMTYVFVKEGFSSLIRFVALLSLSLAVLNILPFPGLDGGRLLFVLVEWVSGKRVNQKFESLTHFVGFALLLLLILFVTYKDVVSLL